MGRRVKQERRSRWYLWTCDLTGCTVTATTHPATDTLAAVEVADVPDGWVVIDPPRFWRGPSLAFHSIEHRNTWAQETVGPMLLGSGS